MIIGLMFLLFFMEGLSISLSRGGFLVDWLREIEAETIGNNDKAKRKLITEVEQVVGLLLRPIGGGR
jgi:ABC-type nickel/cobalt efflux system permease component RcnA